MLTRDLAAKLGDVSVDLMFGLLPGKQALQARQQPPGCAGCVPGAVTQPPPCSDPLAGGAEQSHDPHVCQPAGWGGHVFVVRPRGAAGQAVLLPRRHLLVRCARRE